MPAIAEALGYKATVSSEKKRVLECMESDAINSIITRDKKVGRVHVLRMQDLNHKVRLDWTCAGMRKW